MAETPITKTHENDVIFNTDSLKEFIKLIKRQGSENIEFYSVSELLQPPSAQTYIKTPTGKKDQNLEKWETLYNNTSRQTTEQTLLNFFNNYDSLNYIQYKVLTMFVYEYIPAIEGGQTVIINGQSYITQAQNMIWAKRNSASQIKTTSLQSLFNNRKVTLGLTCEDYSKLNNNNEIIAMRYYSNLSHIISLLLPWSGSFLFQQIYVGFVGVFVGFMQEFSVNK